MTSYWYPKADRVQDFSAKFSSSTMNTDTVTLHSTEGTGWPAYDGGAMAPNMTIKPNFATKTVQVRQHFASNKSSRALENRAGGVQTNTQNTFQIEIVGTCDPTTHKKLGSTQHIYMPEAPDWFLAGIAEVLKWLDLVHPNFVIEDGAPRGWGAYPSSYGASKYRMTFSEWNAAKGIVGHQHIPENFHGDPGAFPIKKLVAIAKGTAVPTIPDVPKTYDKMSPTSYFIGVKGEHVTWLTTRLTAHGFSVSGDTFTEAVRSQVSKFQLKQWPGSSTAKGGDADGFPGTATLNLLGLDPVEVKPTPPAPEPADKVRIRSVNMNVAGYNTHGQKTYKSRVDGFGAKMLDLEPDVITMQEVSNLLVARMRGRIDSILGKGNIKRASGGTDGRYVYYNANTVTRIASGNYVANKTTWFKGDDKQAAWFVGRKDGVLFLEVSVHTENEDGADSKRSAQMLDFLSKTLATAKQYKVPTHNISINGDTNSYNLVRQVMQLHGFYDSARTAKEKVNEEYMTHNNWKAPVRGDHFDDFFLHNTVEVTLWKQYPRDDWSDHNMMVQDRHLPTS